MIEYKIYNKEIAKLEIADGFFKGWPNPPSKTTHHKMMESSYRAIVAIDENKIIGFITIISDGVLNAFIPLLEVIEPYQNQGIGTGLMQQAIEETKDLYALDLSCDTQQVRFYKGFGMHLAHGMIKRNYENQSGSRIVNKTK